MKKRSLLCSSKNAQNIWLLQSERIKVYYECKKSGIKFNILWAYMSNVKCDYKTLDGNALQTISTSMIIDSWTSIVHELGGIIRACFKNTALISSGNNYFNVIFDNEICFTIGNRPSVLTEIEIYTVQKYGIKIHLSAKFDPQNASDMNDSSASYI